MKRGVFGGESSLWGMMGPMMGPCQENRCAENLGFGSRVGNTQGCVRVGYPRAGFSLQ